MSIPGILAALLIFAILVVWVIAPLLRAPKVDALTQSSVERQRERLQLYYSRVLRNLHDLDEDFATGKLDDADYAAERALWVERGIHALKALDTLDAQHLVAPTHADDAAIDLAIDRAVERILAETRQGEGV